MARELDDADKALLTPEEIEAMQEDDASDLDKPVPETITEENLDEALGTGDGEAEDVKAEEEPKAPAVEPVPLAAIEKPTPTFTDADKARIDEIATARAAITDKADEGELTFKEMQEQVAALDKEARDLETKQIRDEERQKAYDDQIEAIGDASWNKACATFFAEQNVDPAKLTPEVGEPFNDIVLAVTGGPLGAGETEAGQLAIALGIFNAKHPGKWPGKVAAPAPAPKPEAKTVPAAAERLIPPTLGGLPATEIEGVGDARFAALDRMQEADPKRFETVLAAMSKADREAYLMAG